MFYFFILIFEKLNRWLRDTKRDGNVHLSKRWILSKWTFYLILMENFNAESNGTNPIRISPWKIMVFFKLFLWKTTLNFCGEKTLMIFHTFFSFFISHRWKFSKLTFSAIFMEKKCWFSFYRSIIWIFISRLLLVVFKMYSNCQWSVKSTIISRWNLEDDFFSFIFSLLFSCL